ALTRDTAISPSGRLIAIPVNALLLEGPDAAPDAPDGVLVFDVSTGSEVCMLRRAEPGDALLAFDPGGERLFAVSPQRFTCWALPGGRAVVDAAWSWPLADDWPRRRRGQAVVTSDGARVAVLLGE